MISATFLTLVFGTIGIRQYEHAHHPEAPHGLSPLYHAAQMLILHSPHFDRGANLWIEAGRWCGVVAFIATLMTLFWWRLRHEVRLFRLSWWKDHVVICGLGEKGLDILRCQKKDRRVVVIDPHPEPQLALRCEEKGAVLISADATNAKALKTARVARAAEIWVCTPQDETNLRIAHAIDVLLRTPKEKQSNKAEITGGARADEQSRGVHAASTSARNEAAAVAASAAGKLTEARAPTPSPGDGSGSVKRVSCRVQFSDIHVRESLEGLPRGNPNPCCNFHFFDPFALRAKDVWTKIAAAGGGGICMPDSTAVHVIVIGFSRMGRSVAWHAIQEGLNCGKRARISVIDRRANEQREHFHFRHPELEKDNAWEITFHPGEAESLTTRRRIEEWASELDTLLHIFVCLDNDARALEVALRLRDVIEERRKALVSTSTSGAKANFKVCVRIRSKNSLQNILERCNEEKPNPVLAFGTVEGCSEDLFGSEPCKTPPKKVR